MYNKILNPKIWNENMTLKDGVKNALNKIINQFVADIGYQIDLVDTRIVGSNASFNYNDKSDIDLHLVVNMDTIPGDSQILKLLYNSARTRFNNNYSMTVKGLPVEISIEDLNSTVTSNGVYSLMQDMWIKQPKKIIPHYIDMTTTKSYQKLVAQIEKVLENPTSQSVRDIINQLYMIRKNSIMCDGEYGKGNLLFKAIRNTGLLQNLKEELYNILSKELTFESMIENLDIKGAFAAFEED